MNNLDLHRGGRGNQNMNHNAVEVARIQSGADVRTTVSEQAPPPLYLMVSPTHTAADHAPKHPKSR